MSALFASTLVSAFLMYAATSSETSLNASERPIATETPMAPMEAAIDAAPAIERMLEPSAAVIAMRDAVIPIAPSPSMKALTSVAILFSDVDAGAADAEARPAAGERDRARHDDRVDRGRRGRGQHELTRRVDARIGEVGLDLAPHSG